MTSDIKKAYASAGSRLLLLDYDGTLSPIKPTPPEGRPTQALLRLLEQLASDPRNTIVIISGRDHPTLDRWLGNLPVDFAAEHGLLIKKRGEAWSLTKNTVDTWKTKVLPLLEEYVQQVPGSLIEEKTAGLVWHYRTAEAAHAASVVPELAKRLTALLEPLGLTLMHGSKVLEIKLAGVDKGKVARRWLEYRHWDFILAAGDDTTDEDLFKAMPSRAFTIKIGPGHSAARTRLKGPMSMRSLLRSLALNSRHV